MSRIKDTVTEVMNNSRKRSKQLQFGILLLAMLLAILGYSIYQTGLLHDQKQIILALFAIITAGITFFYPKILYPLLFVWLMIGNILGVISSFIIFAVIYFLIITPVALTLRLLKKDKRELAGWINKTNVTDYSKLY